MPGLASAPAPIPQLYSSDRPLDMAGDKIGLIRDSSDAADDFAELRRRYAEDGYLYLKRYLDRDLVMAARGEITAQLAAAGLLDPARPAIDAVCRPGAGTPFKPELTRACPTLQRLLYSGRLVGFYRGFYDEPISHYDFTWLRTVGPGKGTYPHCDLPYMGRGTHQHMTCWVPYGDVDYQLGGLMLLEGSHRRRDLLESYVYRDVDTFCSNRPKDVATAEAGGHTFNGTLSHHPPALRNTFGGRWLVREFEAGDVCTFSMFLVHGSSDNRSPDRFRLSTDSRYQRRSEPLDGRWIGANPAGHSAAGKRGRVC